MALWKIALVLNSSGTIVALIAVLQWAGLDPFLQLGLAASLQGNSRIRIFFALGNQNYVAAFLAALVQLAFVFYAERRNNFRARRVFAALAPLALAAAIVITEFRAPILGPDRKHELQRKGGPQHCGDRHDEDASQRSER